MKLKAKVMLKCKIKVSNKNKLFSVLISLASPEFSYGRKPVCCFPTYCLCIGMSIVIAQNTKATLEELPWQSSS